VNAFAEGWSLISCGAWQRTSIRYKKQAKKNKIFYMQGRYYAEKINITSG
jgi:hypothetical protein